MSQPLFTRRDALKIQLAAAAGLALGHHAVASAADLSKLEPILRKIPSSGEELPVIGLGTNVYGVSSDEEKTPLMEVLEQKHALGGRLIDTAQAYGRSEVVIGELLKKLGNRDQYFIATKTPIQADFTKPEELIEQSFKALQVDTIDLMQTHQIGGVDAFLPVFLKMKEAGRIRYVGMSTSSKEHYERTLEAMKTYPLDFIQVDYSIDNRSAEDDMLRLAQERGIAVLTNMPLGGRRGAATAFAKVTGKDLPEWAGDYDIHSWAQFFLKFVVSHPAVTVAIPGTTKLRHLVDNLGAGRGRLPDEAGRKKMVQFWDSIG